MSIAAAPEKVQGLELVPVSGSSFITQFPRATAAQIGLAYAAGRKLMDALTAKAPQPAADQSYDYTPDADLPRPRMG